jgi:hypothetical protein
MKDEALGRGAKSKKKIAYDMLPVTGLEPATFAS